MVLYHGYTRKPLLMVAYAKVQFTLYVDTQISHSGRSEDKRDRMNLWAAVSALNLGELVTND